MSNSRDDKPPRRKGSLGTTKKKKEKKQPRRSQSDSSLANAEPKRKFNLKDSLGKISLRKRSSATNSPRTASPLLKRTLLRESSKGVALGNTIDPIKSKLISELKIFDKQLQTHLKASKNALSGLEEVDPEYKKILDDSDKSAKQHFQSMKNIEAGIPTYNVPINEILHKPLTEIDNADLYILKALVDTIFTKHLLMSNNDDIKQLGRTIHFLKINDNPDKKMIEKIAGRNSIIELIKPILSSQEENDLRSVLEETSPTLLRKGDAALKADAEKGFKNR